MRNAIWMLVIANAALGFTFSLPAADRDERQERSRLCGVWLGFAVEGKGETPDRGPVKVELTITPEVIKGRQFQGREVIDHGEGTYQLDLSKTPHALDGTKLRAGRNKDIWLGIYSLEGDTLKWCVRKKDRPSEFETKDKAFLLILKRQKK